MMILTQIEILYNKYDSLLQQLKAKDDKIKEQQSNYVVMLGKIHELNNRCKEYMIAVSQMDVLRRQNNEILKANQSLKNHLNQIEQSYLKSLSQYKYKYETNQKQKEKFQQINQQFSSKIRLLQQKFEDKNFIFDKDRKQLTQKINQLQTEIHELKNKHISEISLMNTQLLHRQQDIDILNKQNKKLNQSILYSQQTILNIYQQYQQKIQKLNNECKSKIKQIKKQIETHIYNNQILSSKINVLNLQIQTNRKQNQEIRNVINDQKRKSQESLYQAKVIFNQQKSILRENIVQLESKLTRVEKNLNESLRRQKQLTFTIKKLQQSQVLKRNIREVQKRQLDKINRLLLLER